MIVSAESPSHCMLPGLSANILPGVLPPVLSQVHNLAQGNVGICVRAAVVCSSYVRQGCQGLESSFVAFGLARLGPLLSVLDSHGIDSSMSARSVV